MVWRAQKLFLIDQLSSPQTLALALTLPQLAPYMDVTKVNLGANLELGSLPPLDARDATSGTAVKSLDNPASGDSLYDVGPE